MGGTATGKDKSETVEMVSDTRHKHSLSSILTLHLPNAQRQGMSLRRQPSSDEREIRRKHYNQDSPRRQCANADEREREEEEESYSVLSTEQSLSASRSQGSINTI